MKNKLSNLVQLKNSFAALSFMLLLLINPFKGFTQCPLPADVGAINGAVKACPGFSRSYTVPAASGATSYTWTAPAGCDINGQNPYTGTQRIVTVNYGPSFSPPGTITCKANNACGSSAVSSKTVDPYFPGKPSIIDGVKKTCGGETLTYSVTEVAGVTYTWTVSAGATIVSGQGTNQISVNYASGYSGGTIEVAGSFGCGNGPERTANIVNDTPVKPASILGTVVACPGSTVSYSVVQAPNVTSYNWGFPSGATISGQGSNTVNITYPAGYTQGQVTVNAVNSCGSSASIQMLTKSTPAKPDVITGNASGICNSTEVYSIPDVYAATNYTWTGASNSTLISGQGTTTATFSYTSPVNGNISVVASNVCGSSAQRKLPVTGTLVITQEPQATNVCQSDNTTLTVVAPGSGISYQWRKDGIDLTDNSDFSGTTSSQLQIIGADSLNTGNYDVVVSSNCAGTLTSATASLTVNMRAPKPAAIIIPDHACEGETGVVISVPLSAYNTTGYFWDVLNGAVITSGQGTNSITVDFGPNPNSGYSIRCRGTNACGVGIDTSKTWIQRSISYPVISTGPLKVCQGQSNVTYSANPIVGATSYDWYVSSGISIQSGADTIPMVASFAPDFNSGTVCITASNKCMTTPLKCVTVIRDVPGTPGNITGQITSACNTTLNYSITAASGATSYNWTAPSGASVTGGQGTLSAAISFDSFTSGNLCVTGVNTCNNNSTPRCALIKGTPLTPPAITTPTSPICANSTVSFNCTPSVGATSYIWQVPNAEITSGQGSSGVSVHFGITATNVLSTASNACGVSGTRVYPVSFGCREGGVDAVNTESISLQAYPNPADDFVNVVLANSAKADYTITLTDILGRSISKQVVTLDEGRNEIPVDLKNVKKGVYFISVKSASGSQQIKIARN